MHRRYWIEITPNAVPYIVRTHFKGPIVGDAFEWTISCLRAWNEQRLANVARREIRNASISALVEKNIFFRLGERNITVHGLRRSVGAFQRDAKSFRHTKSASLLFG